MSPFRLLAFAAALLLAVPASLPAKAQQPLTPDQKAAFEAVIRDYLLEHPEVIVEALTKMQQKQEQERAEAQQKMLRDRRDELFADPASPVIGNPKGDVTLVEFFDYQCGYCKSVHPDLVRLIESDGKVRLVMKEFPILGPASVVAAKAALAARQQGKYREMHNALMANRGALDEIKILRIAVAAGLDAERLKADMEAPDVRAEIEKNLKLAEALNIQGTPAFVIGDHLVPGAIPPEQLQELVRRQRGG